ncbi:restriction endonuclease subunit S [Clostridium perfringens]|nr:restriction endonuclease subunit S [Clostridium perfringens]
MSFNEWKTYKIDEISNVRGGKRVPKGFNLLNNKTKYPYIRLVDIKNNRVNKENLMFLNKETHEKIKRYKVFTGDICLAIVGNTIGLVFYITEEENGFNLTENAVRITEINKETVCCKFLYYYLFSNLGQEQILSNKVGSAQGKLPIKNIRNIEVRFPPLKEQKAISKILSDLDEKIEVNNKINKNLEEMAQAIFKQWFVDFEFPNEEGKPYKSSGGEMVESELGMIPKGWKICELNELSTLTMGLSPKSSSYNTEGTGTPLLNGAADFNNGLIKANKYTTQETRVCEKGDLVFCIRATIGNLTFSDNKYCLGRGVAALRAKREIFICLIYMNLLNSIEKLKSQATGSVILGLSKPDINNMKVLYPNLETLTKYSNAFFSLFNKKEEIIRENERLEKLRDTLLPKLMSGEIRVPLENSEN